MKSYFRILAIFLLFAPALSAQSQTQAQTQSQPAPPSTDIYVASIKLDHGSITIGKPVNATKHKGYDNQPRFLADGQSFYYTSIRDGAQADIYLYDLKSGNSTQITHTKESEFSPTPMPDGKYISVVRVEPDSTQRLWKFPLDGGEPSLVLENVKRVGYHAWVDENTVALFILGEPNTLQVADVPTGKTELIAEDIGRCLQIMPVSGNVSFAQKVQEKGWYIQKWNPKTDTTHILTSVNSEEADYAWLPDGSMLASSNSKILRWSPKGGWTEVVDLANTGPHSVTRISVSPQGDRIALVAVE